MTARALASLCRALRQQPRGDSLRRGASALQQAAFMRQLQRWEYRPPRDLLAIWSQFNGSSDSVYGFLSLAFFFSSRNVSKIRRAISPTFPRLRNAKPVRRKSLAVKSSDRVTFERGAYRWEIERQGLSVRMYLVRGHAGTAQKKTFASIDAAKSFIAKQIANKQKAGYEPAANLTYL